MVEVSKDIETATGQQTVAWGKQGHAVCKTSCSKYLHGSKLLCAPTRPKVGVSGSTHHKNEVATPHQGTCKHSMQHDGRRPDWRCVGVGVYVEIMNGNVHEELRNRMMDRCC